MLSRNCSNAPCIPYPWILYNFHFFQWPALSWCMMIGAGVCKFVVWLGVRQNSLYNNSWSSLHGWSAGRCSYPRISIRFVSDFKSGLIQVWSTLIRNTAFCHTKIICSTHHTQRTGWVGQCFGEFVHLKKLKPLLYIRKNPVSPTAETPFSENTSAYLCM